MFEFAGWGKERTAEGLNEYCDTSCLAAFLFFSEVQGAAFLGTVFPQK